MAEVKYEDYKLEAVAQLVKIDVSLNPAAIGLSDKEAREKKLWLNKDKLPAEAAIRKKFEELRPELQRQADIAEENSPERKLQFKEEVQKYFAKDIDLGLTAKEASTFLIIKEYGTKKQALEYLKEKSSVKL